MTRFGSSLVVAFAVLATTGTAHANWFTAFWGDVGRGWHRNNCWPDPFTDLDQAAVVAPIPVMVAKGWQRQNLLGDHHFDAESKKLTPAGALKVRWILSQAPLDRRTVFIERTNTADLTQARVEAVQQAIVGINPQGIAPEVIVSDLQTLGRSSEYVDSIGRKYQESIPAPRLPAMQTSSGSSN